MDGEMRKRGVERAGYYVCVFFFFCLLYSPFSFSLNLYFSLPVLAGWGGDIMPTRFFAHFF